MRIRKITCLTLAALLLTPLAALHAAEVPKPTTPNIIFILTD